MRIALVSPYDLGKSGGVQAQVLGLAESLTHSGDEVLVIGPGLPSGRDGVDLGPSLSIPGNKSIVPLTFDPRVNRRIKAAVADVDVVHVHEPLMPLASLAALRSGPPVVATFHAAPGPIGRGLYVAIASQLSRVLGSKVRKVTAVSKTAAAPLPDYLDVEIVPNGVDVAAFRSDVVRETERVCFLGRDEPRKGLDVLLAAWPEVQSHSPAADLVVMGSQRGGAGITWLGRVDLETKVRMLGSSAVYVAPNLGGESFGIVLVEAMAAGAAVVASDLQAFREVAADAAIYFEPGDSSALAARLKELIGSPDKAAAMGEAGTRRAVEFDWSVVAPRYRHVYEKALS